MDMWIRHSCLWLAPLILLAGCGYIGEPLTPALNIPVRIDNLQALQRGGQVIIDFTVPQMTTEGLLLKGLGQIELRAGPGGATPFDLAGWVAGAGRIEVPKPEFGPGTLHSPSPLYPQATILPSDFSPRLWYTPPETATKSALGAGTSHCP